MTSLELSPDGASSDLTCFDGKVRGGIWIEDPRSGCGGGKEVCGDGGGSTNSSGRMDCRKLSPWSSRSPISGTGITSVSYAGTTFPEPREGWREVRLLRLLIFVLPVALDLRGEE